MDFIVIQQAALENSNILDKDIRENYHCIQGTGRRSDRAKANHGHFCVAFPMVAKKDAHRICYRIWYDSIKTSLSAEIFVRYLNNIDLPYFVNCRFIQEAIRVGDHILPGMCMDWVEGDSLDSYIKKNVKATEKIQNLANDFLDMCRELNRRGIAHGDLSNANIIITNDDAIRLIDYDSVYVPRMGDRFRQTTVGCPDFQHPQRMTDVNRCMSSRDDYFSQQVIYLSLLAISKNPSLVELIGEEGLLFSSIDFQSKTDFIESRGCKAIVRLNDSTLNFLLNALVDAVSGPLCQVKSICEILDDKKAKAPSQSSWKVGINESSNGEIWLCNGNFAAGKNIIKKHGEKLSANIGDRISIRTIPNDTYRIKEIRVLTSSGILRLGYQEHFEMPNCDALVEAEFEKTAPTSRQANCNAPNYEPYSKDSHLYGAKSQNNKIKNFIKDYRFFLLFLLAIAMIILGPLLTKVSFWIGPGIALIGAGLMVICMFMDND